MAKGKDANSYTREQMIDYFIGEPEQEPEEEEQATSWEAVKIKPKQTRTERVQLLVTPDLKKSIEKQAKKNKMSINSFVIAVLESYIKANEKKK